MPADQGPDPTQAASAHINDKATIKRLSDMVLDATASGPNFMTIGELMAKLSTQGLAPVILFFGILNTMAVIPGSSAVTGFPVILLGLAVIFGYKGIWLPGRVKNFMFDRAKLHTGVEKVVPWLKKIERYVHPRLWPPVGHLADIVYGASVTLMALVIFLPIPGANLVPAIAIILMSIGFSSRDGAWMAAGLLVGTLAMGIVIGAAMAAIGGAGRFFHRSG